MCTRRMVIDLVFARGQESRHQIQKRYICFFLRSRSLPMKDIPHTHKRNEHIRHSLIPNHHVLADC